ncbi:uncharacterized protein VTP21DRAFT_6403 [Calcarisporiella thermophila]|uniref:uncharacterized protein n=1 Tax=Calcarisporiella thermophila TaxID=911321 RepID=UPI003742DAD1
MLPSNSLHRAARAFTFLLLFAGVSFLINISQSIGYCVLRPISYPAYRTYIHESQAVFTILMLLLVDYFSPVTMIVTGDESVKNMVVKDRGDSKQLRLPEKAIVISNHQIYLDWMYLWFFAYFADAHATLKIILKDSLRTVPIFGWGMQFFDFIFIRRNWTADRVSLEQHLTRLKNSKFWLMIFPEGTVLSQGTRQASHLFSKKMDLALAWNHCLIPRTTGLKFCADHLKYDILDFTVAYEGLKGDEIPECVFPLVDTLVGTSNRPLRRIHVHIRHIPLTEFYPKAEGVSPSGEKGEVETAVFTQKLLEVWGEKEEMLKHFYDKGGFPSSAWENGLSPTVMPLHIKSKSELLRMGVFVFGPLLLACKAFQWCCQVWSS